MQLSTPTDAVPSQIEGPGTLYLRFFDKHSALVRVAGALEQENYDFERDRDVLVISVPTSPVAPLVALLRDALFVGEQSVVKAIWDVQGAPRSIHDCFNVESLKAFLARAQSGWFLDMMRDGRFETYFQPIISVAHPERVLAFEALLRGRIKDEIVAPQTLFEVARGLNLGRELDDAARLCAIKSAAKHRLKSKIFLNISPNALGDGREVLLSTLQAAEDARLLREQIVFEVVESECIDDVPQLKDALAGLRKAGFRVALDDLGAGYASLQLLSQLRPDYVKLDRELVSGVDCDRFKALIAEKLLETARALNIITVAEGVESRGEWEWLRQHGGDFAQGFYFAHPASHPPVMSSRGAFHLAHAALAA